MENAALVSSILAHAPIGLAFFDREHRFVRINQFLAEMNGISVEDHLGRRLGDILPENAEVVVPLLEKVIRTGESIPETIVTGQTPRLPGVPRSWVTGYFPVKSPQNDVLFVGVFAIEISDRVRAQQNAEESVRRLETVLSAMSEGVVTSDPEGNIFDWNQAALRMHGFDNPEQGRRHLSEFYKLFELRTLDGTLVPGDQWPLARVLRGETFFGRELQVRRLDTNHELVVSYSGSPVRDSSGAMTLAVLTLQDVTERIQREAMLRESEAQFRQLANSIPQLAWMAEPDGAIFWYNDRWYSYTGTTPEEMAGWGWEKVHDPEILPEVKERWLESLTSGKPFEMEFPLRGDDGTFRWFLTRVEPVFDSSGKIVLWFGTNTDIEAKRNIAHEKQQLLESEMAARVEAERVSRMKDEFLATLSHELRTPLNAILGWSQILERTRNNETRLREGLSAIVRNTRAQAQLIDDLLDMSSITTGKLRLNLQEVQIADVVDAAVESVMPMADAKEIHVIKILDPSAGPVSGDPARLQQVVWNLLTNAVKFTPKQGRIEVLLERVNSSVEIHVSDTGQGIDPAFLPFIFERFRQADSSITRKFGGLGLGLSLVKQLAELHGGTVRAKSRGLGEGATFTLSLPVSVARIAALRDERDAIQRENGSLDIEVDLAGITVLVVDDEKDVRDIARRILEEAHATVVTAGSARDALELLERVRPDVLLSDIGMPDEDGYQLIRRIRALPSEQCSRIPAAALTAYARSEDRRRALLAGYNSHIVKPIEPAELVAVIGSITGRTGTSG